MKDKRCYFVIDMKSFFASVECAERGLDSMTTRLVVADSTRGDRTICLAVSPALKALGVRNRCRLYEIPKNIDYIVAQPRMSKYIEYAGEIYGIYLNYIDKNDIHVYSIDECFLDVTDYLSLYHIRAKDFARKLMNEISSKLGVPSTVGIGTNMYLAKIALDITAKKSPERIGWLTEDKFRRELWDHTPLTDFWGISGGISARLAKYKIKTMRDIVKANEDILYKEFGVNAELIIDHANGVESCTISDIKNYKSQSKSISNSQILPYGYSFDDAKIVLREMINEGCLRLVREGCKTTTIHINLGYEGFQREVSKGTIRLESRTDLDSEIEPIAVKLFENIADKKKLIRRISFSFENLTTGLEVQSNMFSDYEKNKKEKQLVKSIIEIKDKYGRNSILRGIDFEEKATQRERNLQIGGHRSGES